MLQVKNLTITHKKDLTTLVEGLSFVLAPGDRAALIGEEGNGKSTVLKLLYDPALVEPYAEWTGEIVDKGLRKGWLAQELTAEELALPVWEFCQRSPGFDGADPKALDRAARQVGLGAELFWEGRAMSTLSGGERVKLRLALLLLDGPDVLLLDEPSNDLDLQTLEWLEGFLLGCKVPVLYISHDEALLERTANVVIHLERLRRRTVSRCTAARTGYARYVEERAVGFARQEQAARKERAEYDAKMEKFRQIRDKVEHAQATVPRYNSAGIPNPSAGRLLKKKMHTMLSMGRRFEREKEHMTAMPEWEEAILTAFDEGKSAFPAGKTVLRLDLPELRAGARAPAQDAVLEADDAERAPVRDVTPQADSGEQVPAQDVVPEADGGERLPVRDVVPEVDGGEQVPAQDVVPEADNRGRVLARNVRLWVDGGEQVPAQDVVPEADGGGRVLARNVRLWVDGEEKVGIVGPNGVGKSTLLKLVADELLPRRDLRAAYMPQDYGDLLLGDRTPVEVLAPSGRREDVTRARTLLGNMKYKAEEMEHPAAGLSGGQRAKLLFLAMVLNGANVLVLDEPTRNFSPLSAPVIRRVLEDFPGVIISVSHDRLYLDQVCTRVLELTENGLKEC